MWPSYRFPEPCEGEGGEVAGLEEDREQGGKGGTEHPCALQRCCEVLIDAGNELKTQPATVQGGRESEVPLGLRACVCHLAPTWS